MTVSTHDALRKEVALWALGALDRQDREAFEAHVLSCDECAEAARWLSEASVALAGTVPSLEPPPGLRARVLDEISARPSSGIDERAAPSEFHRPAFRVVYPWLLAAAVALAVGLGGYAVRLRDRVGSLEERLSAVSRRADVLEQETAALRRATEADAQTVVVLSAADLRRVELAGQVLAPKASARAFLSRSRGLVFTASHLPPLPPGRIYQLWIVTARSAVDAGLLKPSGDGVVHTVFAAPADLNAIAVAVTLEPDGGVPAPTGDKYLVGLVN